MSRPFSTESAYRAIGHLVRRDILDMLRRDEQTVSEIHGTLSRLGNAALSNHLRILRETGLVKVRRRGTHRVYTLDARPLHELVRWLRPFEQHGRRRVASSRA